MRRAVVSVGGMTVAVDSASSAASFEESYRSFRSSDPRPGAVWRLRGGSLPGKFLRLPGRERWTLKAGKGRALLLLRLGKDPGLPWKAAEISADGKEGTIWIGPGEGPDSPPLFFLDLLLFAYLLARRGGAIVHAAAVKRGKDAFLFPGPEGRGKSTWSELAAAVPGCEILGEDKVIVKKNAHGFQVYGSPWNPRPAYRSPASGRLAGVFYLSPGPANRLRRLSPREALPRFLSALFLPFAAPREIMAPSVLAASVVAAVPAAAFSFRNDASAASYFFRRRS